jgi:hypothetical protein
MIGSFPCQLHWGMQSAAATTNRMWYALHIEMGFLKLIGTWLDGSGWTTALVDANVASSGTAESFIKATSVT